MRPDKKDEIQGGQTSDDFPSPESLATKLYQAHDQSQGNPVERRYPGIRPDY